MTTGQLTTSFGAYLGVGMTLVAGISYCLLSPVRRRAERELAIQGGLAGVGVLVTSVCTQILTERLASEATGEVLCPISQLKNIVRQAGARSLVAKTFQVLEDNQAISCANFLPWKREFLGETGEIDGIGVKSLSGRVMWGIDDTGRPFAALKYLCDEQKEGAVTYFQRFPRHPTFLASAGRDQPRECNLGSVSPLLWTEKFLTNLHALLKDREVETEGLKEKHVIQLVDL